MNSKDIPRTLPRDYNMSNYHMSFIGQRADKIKVTDVNHVDEIEHANGIVTSGVVKEVEHYTMTCPDCDGDGYYDQRCDVICEDCGVVISGEQAVIRTEYNADAKDSGMGSSRGLEKMGEAQGAGHEPS